EPCSPARVGETIPTPQDPFSSAASNQAPPGRASDIAGGRHTSRCLPGKRWLLLHRAFEKENVILVIFHQKCHRIFHAVVGVWSCIQKRLLWPGEDSTPTLPP